MKIILPIILPKQNNPIADAMFPNSQQGAGDFTECVFYKQSSSADLLKPSDVCRNGTCREPSIGPGCYVSERFTELFARWWKYWFLEAKAHIPVSLQQDASGREITERKLIDVTADTGEYNPYLPVQLRTDGRTHSLPVKLRTAIIFRWSCGRTVGHILFR